MEDLKCLKDQMHRNSENMFQFVFLFSFLCEILMTADAWGGLDISSSISHFGSCDWKVFVGVCLLLQASASG